MKEIPVSIVIPVYNMADCLSACVRSVCVQDYKALEILLVDDGSSDDSLCVCRKLAEDDSRIRVLHTENRGSGPARNYGLEHASGDYVFFSDADDYLEPGAISAMVAATQGGENDLVVFGYRICTPDGKTRGVKTYPTLTRNGEAVRQNYFPYATRTSELGIQGAPWNKLFSMKNIRRYAVTFPPLRRHQDEGFIARYVTHAEKIAFSDKVLYTHFVNDLKKTWDKYPRDYMEAVIGLYEERKTNILVWNPQDYQTHARIQQEFFDNGIKALELCFSPKHGFNCRRRLAFLKESAAKADLTEIPKPAGMGAYKRAAWHFLENRRYGLLCGLLWCKVQLDRFGMTSLLKREG